MKKYILFKLLLIISLVVTVENLPAASYIKVDSSSAVKALLIDASNAYKRGMQETDPIKKNQAYEQAAASLERALRINPRQPTLWHNLAGVRLTQKDWMRAANLATNSNMYAGNEKQYYQLRIRNWMLITLACEGMGDMTCAREARKRAQNLAQALY
jgi:cytochrome c-type biogenesis protein CcmH/NrfG